MAKVHLSSWQCIETDFQTAADELTLANIRAAQSYISSLSDPSMDRNDWDDRYQTGSYSPRSYPSDLLVKNAEWLPQGRALDLATGAGRNALYLANRGYDVDAIDISSTALDIARTQADERSLDVNWIRADIEEDDLPDTAYDVIVVSFYLTGRLRDLKNRLTPGGVLLYEHHVRSTDPVDRGPSDQYRFSSNELLRACLDLTVLRYTESTRIFESGDRAGQDAAIASLVAQNSPGGALSYPPEVGMNP